MGQLLSGGIAMASRLRRRPYLLLVTALIVAIIHVPTAHSATVLWVGGTGGSLAKLLPANPSGSTADLLDGLFEDDQITTIDYPSALWPITGLGDNTLGASVNIGAERLATAVKSSEGPQVLAGTSQGALVVQQVEASLNKDPSVPASTTFVLIADPDYGIFRGATGLHIPILDYRPAAIPETRFNTIIVVNEYDLIGDPIKQPWNLLTDINAVMGFLYVHPVAHNASLSSVPAENITTSTNSQGGTTTVYRVPTHELPITMPLRQLGIERSIVDGIDSVLRPIIDLGYEDPQVRIARPPALHNSPRQLAPTRKGTVSQRSATTSHGAAAASGDSTARHTTGTSQRRHKPAA